MGVIVILLSSVFVQKETLSLVDSKNPSELKLNALILLVVDFMLIPELISKRLMTSPSQSLAVVTHQPEVHKSSPLSVLRWTLLPVRTDSALA